MGRSISILATAATIAFSASPALAQDARSVSFMVYSTDFATAQSRAVLEDRIQSAVEELCGVNAAAEGISWGDIKQCRAKARLDISGQIASLDHSRDVQLSAR